MDRKYYKINIKNNEIIDKSYLNYLKKQIEDVNLFGIAKEQKILDRNLLGNLKEEYIGETAIFVSMDYYLLDGLRNMFTFGIGSCCGLFISNNNKRFLMHISPKYNSEQILSLINFLNLSKDSEIYIFPGSACEYERAGNCFDYEKLAYELELLGNSVYTRKFNSQSGSVYFLDDKLFIQDNEPICIKDFAKSDIIKR